MTLDFWPLAEERRLATLPRDDGGTDPAARRPGDLAEG